MKKKIKTNKKLKVVLGLVIIFFLLVLVLFLINFPRLSYQKFTVVGNQETHCEHFTLTCKCFGSLSIEKSYPPRFLCKGYEYCIDDDYYLPANCEKTSSP